MTLAGSTCSIIASFCACMGKSLMIADALCGSAAKSGRRHAARAATSCGLLARVHVNALDSRSKESMTAVHMDMRGSCFASTSAGDVIR